LLDESFAKHVADNNKRIEANAEFEGLSAMTDGLTNLHTPLVNVLTGTPEGVILNKIVDCSDHCATGGTKDALFLVNEIWPVLEDTWPRCYDQSQGLFSTTQTWLCVCAKKNSTAREACANASEREKAECAREPHREEKRACLRENRPRESDRTYCKKERRPNADYDLFLFDGASSEQSAGEFLEHRAPWSTKVRCGMHLGHSFFDDVAKIPLVAQLIEDHTTLYDWFGATRHKIHAMFKKQSQAFNKGRHLAVIKGGESRMAHFFAAMHRDLRLKHVYRATVASSPYVGARVQSQG
jgi:hypothetical protein